MVLMYHDDDCGELLDHEGRCPKCQFHPDMQSTAFKEVDSHEVQLKLQSGRKFLGLGRKVVS